MPVRYSENRIIASEILDPTQGLISAASPAWFAVFTQPKHEKKVVSYLESRDIESFLPTCRLKHVWKNRQTRLLDVPLFPSYLFVKLEHRQRGNVLGVPGVLSIVGNSHPAGTVPERYIDALREGVAQNRILPHEQPAIGERVLIVSGPFAGFEGVVAYFRSEFRVVVTIQTIQKSVSVRVSCNEIQPVLRGEDRAITEYARLQAR